MTPLTVYLICNTSVGRTLDVIPACWFTIIAFVGDLVVLVCVFAG